MSTQPVGTAKPKPTKAERRRADSARMAAKLNARMAEDNRRRAAANEAPLMKLDIPLDCFSRPRMYGFRLDEQYWAEYARSYRHQLGKDRKETAKLGETSLFSITLRRLRQLSGIEYLSPEWCLPEDYSRAEARKNALRQLTPPRDDAMDDDSAESSSAPIPFRDPEPEPMFMILMVFMVTRYNKVLQRPTQRQIDILTTELNREPEWYVDAEQDD